MEKQKSIKPKTDRQIADLISRKIWNWDSNTEQDLKDIIREALELKTSQIVNKIKKWDNNLKKKDSGDLDKDIENLLQELNGGKKFFSSQP